MDLQNLKNEIKNFQDKVKEYRDLMLASRHYALPQIEKNFDKIATMRSDLIKFFAKLEEYVKKLGKNPKMNDGVWNVWYSPYDNAFTNDVLIRVGKSTDAIISDLDYIIGKIESLSSQDELNILLENRINKPKEKIHDSNISAGGNITAGGDIIITGLIVYAITLLF